MNLKAWSRVALVALLSTACSTRSTGSDSETHFVCSADPDCRTKLGEGFSCVEHACQKIAVDDAGPSCVPGSTISCTGASGCRGTQQCLAGKYGSCVCENGPLVPPLDASVDTSIGPLTPRDSGSSADSGCSVTRFAGELIAQNLFVLLDQSIGMANVVPGSSSTWWQGAVDGVEAFVTSQMAEGVNMAIQYFPLGASPGSCTAAYDQPEVPFTTLPGNASAVVSSLHAHAPFGFSTVGPALNGAIAHMTSVSQGKGGQEFKVVLVTGSGPNLCEPKALSEIAALAALGTAATPRVSTYVIALDRAVPIFEPVAVAGGTNQAIAVTGGDVRSAVRDGLQSIVAGGAPCDILLPPLADGGTVDPAFLRLSYGLLDGGVVSITRVDGPSNCAPLTRDGWYVDDTDATRKIVLCPDLCAHPWRRRVDVLYGCR